MTTRDLNIRGEGAAMLRRIERALPETFYAGLPIALRVEYLVASWQRAMKTLDEVARVAPPLDDDDPETAPW